MPRNLSALPFYLPFLRVLLPPISLSPSPLKASMQNRQVTFSSGFKVLSYTPCVCVLEQAELIYGKSLFRRAGAGINREAACITFGMMVMLFLLRIWVVQVYTLSEQWIYIYDLYFDVNFISKQKCCQHKKCLEKSCQQESLIHRTQCIFSPLAYTVWTSVNIVCTVTKVLFCFVLTINSSRDCSWLHLHTSQSQISVPGWG